MRTLRRPPSFGEKKTELATNRKEGIVIFMFVAKDLVFEKQCVFRKLCLVFGFILVRKFT